MGMVNINANTATAAALLARCEALGIVFQVAGGRLRHHGDPDDLTPELCVKIATHESELVELLTRGRICPSCGSAHIAPGKRRLWCLDCQTDIGPAGDAQEQPETAALEWLESHANGRRTWTRADVAGLQVIDWPEPCEVCGAFDRWQDLRGGWHCQRCEPNKTGPRLRRLAHQLRWQYGISAPNPAAPDPAAPDLQAGSGSRTIGKPWPPEIPDTIAADPCPACSDCGRPVIPGQPGRPAGLCFDCLNKQKGR
jgi:hypothetical protein